MTRGGFFAVYASTLLVGDGFPDLSLAAVGGWLRLRAAFDLTQEPVSQAQAGRLRLTPDVLNELAAAHVLEETDGRYTPVGMPDMPRKPSDDPEATRLRKAREREREKEAKRESTPRHATPLHSSVTLSRVTARDIPETLQKQVEETTEKKDGKPSPSREEKRLAWNATHPNDQIPARATPPADDPWIGGES